MMSKTRCKRVANPFLVGVSPTLPMHLLGRTQRPVFRDSKKLKGYRVVSDLQLYLDLMGFPPSGPEEADYLVSRFKKKGRSFV